MELADKLEIAERKRREKERLLNPRRETSDTGDVNSLNRASLAWGLFAAVTSALVGVGIALAVPSF